MADRGGGEGLQRGTRKLLGVTDMFIILMYTHMKTYQIAIASKRIKYQKKRNKTPSNKFNQ